MNRPMEERLRAAFNAKASQVTEAALSRSAADLHGPADDGERDTSLPESGWQRHRSGGWLRPISAAAAIAALSGGLYRGTIWTGTTERPSAPAPAVPAVPQRLAFPCHRDHRRHQHHRDHRRPSARAPRPASARSGRRRGGRSRGRRWVPDGRSRCGRQPFLPARGLCTW